MSICLKNIPAEDLIVQHTGNKGSNFPISLPCDTIVWVPGQESCYLVVEDGTLDLSLSAVPDNNPLYFEDRTALSFAASSIDVSLLTTSLSSALSACFAAPCTTDIIEEYQNTGICTLLMQNGIYDIYTEDDFSILVECPA